MRKILNILSLIGVIAFCMKYYFLGKITLGFAGGAMIFTVILAALDSLLTKVIKVAVALIGFGLFLADYFYDMKTFMGMLQPILVMLVTLFGIYIMVKGVFGSKDKVKYEFDKKTGKMKKLD